MRLILHAGTHKTGTTSIQKVLADNREGLRAQGLIYPDGGTAFPDTRVPHHKFSHALTGVDSGGLERAETFLAEAVRSAKSNDTILISAEPVYRNIAGYDGWDKFTDPAYWVLRKEYLETLAHVLEEFEAEIILFFRNKEDFSRSLYHEIVLVKRHWLGSLEDFKTAFAPWFEYEKQIALFQSIFADVRVFHYEDALSPGLLPFFFKAIDFSMPKNADTVWLRRSSHSSP